MSHDALLYFYCIEPVIPHLIKLLSLEMYKYMLYYEVDSQLITSIFISRSALTCNMYNINITVQCDYKDILIVITQVNIKIKGNQ